MCSNQTFWEKKICNREDNYRCTGDRPGQCAWSGHTWTHPQYTCIDGSSDIEPASKKEGGGCGEKLMCTAQQHTKWDGLDVCIDEQYKCDGVFHCQRGEDEIDCSQEATKWCGSDMNCDKHYKQLEGGICGEEKLMCTARAGRWAGWRICLSEKFQCDNFVQCEDARDEDNCEEEYLNRGIFTRNDRFLCKSPFLNISNGKQWFPMRGIR